MSTPGSQPLRLKEWLMLQIDSGKYPGLRWENQEKTLFRIPWKHAAKHDYSAQQDAALFKAWAVYKGKFREESGSADPSVWKTRIRCALNKSPDFQEVHDNSQMDVAEPYKVYRIVSEPRASPENGSIESRSSPNTEPPTILKEQQAARAGDLNKASHQEANISPKIMENEAQHKAAGRDCLTTIPFFWETHPMDQKAIDISDVYSPSASDFWLHVRLYYRDRLVTEVTTQTAEGCRIVPWSLTPHLFGPCPALPLEEISLPSPHRLSGILSPGVDHALHKLLEHLDKGVLLWVAPEGVFVKRQCQVRVYWSGPLAPHTDQPNKLERERTCKVLDTELFMHEMETYVTHNGPEPQYQFKLCFGEEYPDASKVNTRKLVTAHVEPVFARELFLNAQKKRRKKPESS
ncbi:interferon regulatory factor 4-like [Spea bombifrons]|uniref:interferon regulatory factor 4-like n=1 Tax=Spea bombifrons TaxID=233779 RepID=UPI00234BD9CF|nr:interferon regulatory factor 4-like [Spea bombifrons]